MSCFSFLYGGHKSRKNDGEVKIEAGDISMVKIYSHKELRQATDNFSEVNKLGQGGFGSVYKAKLKDGSIAAIKVLSTSSQQGVKEFLTEINVISRINHENLVELYGCCVDAKHRMLVYGYLENNSLASTLLGGDGCDINFNWKVRRKISIGIARGLAYLHEETKPHIVHRDIKASNILLDKNLNAKISDFGLAKLLPANSTHVTTRVAGTIGYVAPEYAFSGHVTRKSDTYSFGVLLLEIVSGRSNTNMKLSSEERYLLEKVWLLHERNELVGIVDPKLNGQFDADEACRFMKVALLCTQDSTKSRPRMSSVVKMLEGKKEVDMEINRPGLISDFLMPTHETNSKGMNSTFVNSEDSSSNNTVASLSFTAVYDRD